MTPAEPVAELVLTECGVGAAYGAVLPATGIPITPEEGAMIGVLGGLAGSIATVEIADPTESDLLIVGTAQLYGIGVGWTGGLALDSDGSRLLAGAVGLASMPVATTVGIAVANAVEPPPGDVALVRLGAGFGMFAADATFRVAPAYRGAPVAARFLAGGAAGGLAAGLLAPLVSFNRADVNYAGLLGGFGGVVGLAWAGSSYEASVTTQAVIAVVPAVVGLTAGFAVRAGRAADRPTVTFAPRPGGFGISGRL